MQEKIENIIIWNGNRTEYCDGTVPIQWSWEEAGYYCPPKAFLLYRDDKEISLAIHRPLDLSNTIAPWEESTSRQAKIVSL